MLFNIFKNIVKKAKVYFKHKLNILIKSTIKKTKPYKSIDKLSSKNYMTLTLLLAGDFNKYYSYKRYF